MPTLTIVFENREVRTFELVEEVISIGRSVENNVEIPDPNMSRRHCQIERQNGKWIIRDCNSSNGTRVNGRRVLSHLLSDGDRVECGHSVLTYRETGPWPSAGGSGTGPAAFAPAERRPSEMIIPSKAGIGPGDGTIRVKRAPRPTIPDPAKTPAPAPSSAILGPVGVPSTKPSASPRERRFSDSMDSSVSWLENLSAEARDAETPQRLPALRPPTEREDPGISDERLKRDDLRRLLEINKAINSQHDVRKLLAVIIQHAIELIGAERGFLVLQIKGELKVEIARNITKEQIDDPGGDVSKGICAEVISTARPLLTTNAMGDSRYGRFASVMGLNLRSILCVPLKIKRKVLGVVYVDNPHEGAFSPRDVEMLSAFSDQAAIAIDNARLLREVKQKERIEQELKIANEIQRKLLPREVPQVPGFEIAGHMIPAKEVGGDYYDYVKMDDGSVLVAIGDVSGKGIGAGLIMATARAALRSLADTCGSPREIVRLLNRRLLADLDKDLFMSLLLLRLQPDTGRVVFTGAGHEHLLIYSAASKQVEARKAGGMVLGLADDISPHLNQEEVVLAPGDAIVLYTDGMTELMNKKREQYGLERLVAAFGRLGSRPPHAIIDALLDEATDFRGRAPQHDDLTLVTLRRM